MQSEKFLKIRSKELRQGFDGDGSIIISFYQLYDRVKTWEDFMIKYPDFILKSKAEGYYKEYFLTLLEGESNTTVYGDDNVLLPEIKTLYKRIINQNEPRKSTRIISKYYSLLKANRFRRLDNDYKFLKKNGLVE